MVGLGHDAGADLVHAGPLELAGIEQPGDHQVVADGDRVPALLGGPPAGPGAPGAVGAEHPVDGGEVVREVVLGQQVHEQGAAHGVGHRVLVGIPRLGRIEVATLAPRHDLVGEPLLAGREVAVEETRPPWVRGRAPDGSCPSAYRPVGREKRRSTKVQVRASGSGSTACPGGLHDARLAVGVLDAHLALEPVRIGEEQAQDGAEVGDEAVGRAAADSRSRITVKASRDAACRPMWSSRPRPNMGVWWSASALPVELEHVELGVRSDVDERQPHAVLGGAGRARPWRRTCPGRRRGAGRCRLVSTATWFTPSSNITPPRPGVSAPGCPLHALDATCQDRSHGVRGAPGRRDLRAVPVPLRVAVAPDLEGRP